jgi:hypothetical protein
LWQKELVWFAFGSEQLFHLIIATMTHVQDLTVASNTRRLDSDLLNVLV